ncbi:SDR family NAD(P)-dependent oxidoreductase [Actinomycetospora termitidis]|uniref:SDR family NAD(P)-dependent oxidoreductase n=1 Tax=Actinomycetospora termitidis TaxID=3053470 RepID=A0ABT7M5Z5_9PSEU|nr:SDR family NAD(P)-dependent oxidoreductase [Actinomycetospora sp. Odt1-22]MDL5156081.1 SDR family NAD(P)-dependent oxidoreductase [Actinomycetospora sp. Odt1-22]
MTETAGGRFGGRVAVVTGAGSGLGRAAARRLVDEGAEVLLLDRDVASVQEAASELAGASAYELDVSDARAVAATFDAIVERYGRIDALVNNAGVVGEQRPVHRTTDEMWSSVMRVNADGAFYVLRAALGVMVAAGSGSVVNMSSSSGLSGKPHLAPYGFSKAGIVGLTRTAAVEYAAANIRVNAVAPSAVRTPLVEAHIRAAPDPDAMERQMESQSPMPGMGTPEDVAAVIAFLLSDDAARITGLTVPVDGGYHAT